MSKTSENLSLVKRFAQLYNYEVSSSNKGGFIVTDDSSKVICRTLMEAIETVDAYGHFANYLEVNSLSFSYDALNTFVEQRENKRYFLLKATMSEQENYLYRFDDGQPRFTPSFYRAGRYENLNTVKWLVNKHKNLEIVKA